MQTSSGYRDTRHLSTGMPTDELHESLDGLGVGNQNTSRGVAKPAPPIIALSLLTIQTPPGSPSLLPIDVEEYTGYPRLAGHSQEPLLPTSCASIDIALHGGFPYQHITSLSSAHSVERSLLAMHTVASHLLAKPHAHAVWVDAEGVFSPARLGEVIKARLEDAGEIGLKKTVSSVLDRVQIYRVVDMQGLLEVLEEIKSRLGDEAEAGTDMEEAAMRMSEVGRIVNDSQDDIDDEKPPQQETQEKIIQDSQGEEQDDWDDNEEDDKKKEKVKLQKAATEEEAEKHTSPEQTPEGGGQGGGGGGDGGGGEGGVAVVVDTISHLLSDLRFAPRFNPRGFKRNPYEGEDKWHQSEKPEATVALFVDFYRTFNFLARDREICLLLLNDVTPAQYDDSDVYVRGHELQPSRFHAYTGVKPALGPVYAEYVDLSVLLIKQPQPNAVASTELGDVKQRGSLEEMKEGDRGDHWVTEVLNDRYGESVGRWGVFGVEGVSLIDASYM